MTTVLIVDDDKGCGELARALVSADAKINVGTIGKVDRKVCVCVPMSEPPAEEQGCFIQTRNKSDRKRNRANRWR